uniref:Uncharacterized protein n=1 Tax=Oryza meridionalis TaxID=40149 RepID=A0A0E0DPG6_9ORYZ
MWSGDTPVHRAVPQPPSPDHMEGVASGGAGRHCHVPPLGMSSPSPSAPPLPLPSPPPHAAAAIAADSRLRLPASGSDLDVVGGCRSGICTIARPLALGRQVAILDSVTMSGSRDVSIPTTFCIATKNLRASELGSATMSTAAHTSTDDNLISKACVEEKGKLGKFVSEEIDRLQRAPVMLCGCCSHGLQDYIGFRMIVHEEYHIPERAVAWDMLRMYNDFIDSEQRRRIERLELFDEFEDCHMMQLALEET